jgi:hypothetical protein
VFGRSNKIDSGKRLCHSSDSQPNEVTTLSGETVFHYKIHWEEEMTREYPALGTLVLLAFFSLATPGYAQTAAATTKSTATVESVPGKSSDARTQGDFLVLQTKSGSINGGLTPFALNEKGGISISAGQQVKVTGLMMTIQNKQVFLIRTLEVDGRTYELRSKRGAPLEHPARNGASSTQSKGGQL